MTVLIQAGVEIDLVWIAKTAWEVAAEMEKEANRLDGVDLSEVGSEALSTTSRERS